MKKIYIFFISFFLIFFNYSQKANEILIYGDSITYDEDKNITASGNAKVIADGEIITSDLIIYKNQDQEFILPLEFSFKDNKNNYYSGTNGKFNKDLKYAEINNVKILLNDGSRIVGKSAIRNNHIDIVKKGSYSPCKSRINIKDFICPIWQLEGEKILHDNKNLFLYQKHAKMRVLDIPVFYIPYIVTPSPLRKKRKSGFLTPSVNFNFLDTKVTQSTSLPYYFNIDIDKELTLTPIINYGGGVDSSQRFIFDYNQILSGGNLKLKSSIDTKFENENNEEWFKNGSLITNYNQNLNEKYKLNIQSALQTSRTYLRSTDLTNNVSSDTSLSSTINLEGYNLNKIDDKFLLNLSSYQVVQGDEDNSLIPTVFPFISYSTGKSEYQKTEYENTIQGYNIFRDKASGQFSRKQKKLSLYTKTNNEFIRYFSKFKFETELHNQYYDTEGKLINNELKNNSYYKFFPISAMSIETPFRIKNRDLTYKPNISLIISSGQSNSNKLSNEESTNNNYNINTQSELNRYTGTDKLDNSKRIKYGINIYKSDLQINLSQNYEFTQNSNYHKETGNYDYLSDALGELTYSTKNNKLDYNLRYSPSADAIKKQQINLENNNFLGKTNVSYLDEKVETNTILSDGNENITVTFDSQKIKEFSKINLKGIYDLRLDQANEYKIGYSYFDECFGINIDYNRIFYKDDTLKPSDNLTLMFSFKNLGSYKSTNLAVSETDKQDIEWISQSVNNELFD